MKSITVTVKKRTTRRVNLSTGTLMRMCEDQETDPEVKLVLEAAENGRTLNNWLNYCKTNPIFSTVKTLIHTAPLHRGLLQWTCEEAIDLLLRKGADIHARTTEGWTTSSLGFQVVSSSGCFPSFVCRSRC